MPAGATADRVFLRYYADLDYVAIGEAHVYEDVMQLVDWIREDKR